MYNLLFRTRRVAVQTSRAFVYVIPHFLPVFIIHFTLIVFVAGPVQSAAEAVEVLSVDMALSFTGAPRTPVSSGENRKKQVMVAHICGEPCKRTVADNTVFIARVSLQGEGCDGENFLVA